jgi:hypothetical protein
MMQMRDASQETAPTSQDLAGVPGRDTRTAPQPPLASRRAPRLFQAGALSCPAPLRSAREGGPTIPL